MKCAFKQRFGIPCPACGMTRAVVLTFARKAFTAAELNPGGPALVLGAVDRWLDGTNGAGRRMTLVARKNIFDGAR